MYFTFQNQKTGNYISSNDGWERRMKISGRKVNSEGETFSSGSSTSRNTLFETEKNIGLENSSNTCKKVMLKYTLNIFFIWKQAFVKIFMHKLNQNHDVVCIIAIKSHPWLSPLLLVFLVCGGRDFLKFRPVRLGTMASALALDAVLSTTAGATVVDGFAPPSAAGSFNHSSR